MAFQQGAMNSQAPGTGPDHHGPQAAEYTLQGVMRFLQIEWHNHERARNTWDIERAEMKAKIAKLEGESRHSKKINEQLERQIRMLEIALKNERAKKKPTDPTDPPLDSPPDPKRSAKSATSDKDNAKRGKPVASLMLTVADTNLAPK